MNLKSCVVKDYMARTVVTFKPDTPVLDAVHTLVKNRIAGAPVVDDEGNLVGMLSELDCMKVALQAGYYGDYGGPVRDFMSEGVKTVNIEMSIVDLAQVFINDEHFHDFAVSTVWGTPTPETAPLLQKSPCISIRKKAGDRLKDLLDKGAVRVRLRCRGDN